MLVGQELTDPQIPLPNSLLCSNFFSIDDADRVGDREQGHEGHLNEDIVEALREHSEPGAVHRTIIAGMGIRTRL